MKIPERMRLEMYELAVEKAPVEACGLIGGKGDLAEEFFPMTNIDDSSDHFSLDPKEQFSVMKEMRRKGLDLVGIWHSHPATPARMSDEDIRLAYTPGVAYLIQSLVSPPPSDLKAFLPREDPGGFSEATVSMIPGDPPAMRLPVQAYLDPGLLRREIGRFEAGEISAEQLKALRVPMGIYAQRSEGRYMMRVRIPAGGLTTDQARILAGLVERHGSGMLHVSTRQDIQLHDIPLGETPGVLDELLDAGLSTKGGGGNTVRNITTCFDSGICPREVFDIRPHCVALSEYLLSFESSYNLPRKYKIAFSACPRDCAETRTNDLGFTASMRDGERGFLVTAGGGMGAFSRIGETIEEFLPEASIIRTAEAIKRLFDRHGDRRDRARARLRFVVERMGMEKFRSEYGRFMEEVERDGVPDFIPPESTPAPPQDSSPVPPPTSSPAPPHTTPDGTPERFIMLHLSLGDISSTAMRRLADLLDDYGIGSMRTTQGQSIAVPLDGIAGERSGELEAGIEAIDPTFLRPGAMGGIVSCTGARHCRLGLCLSRNLSSEIGRAIGDLPASGAVDIRVSGCPNSCGRHPVGMIGLAGAVRHIEGRPVPYYRLYIDGEGKGENARLGEEIGLVPARNLPGLMRRILEGAGPDFRAWWRNGGRRFTEAAIEEAQTIPPYGDAPEYYRDWGSTEDFSLAGRSTGECGAGVLELIQADLRRASLYLSRGNYREAVLAAAGAFLVTRGEEPKGDYGVFRAFEKHFIETGIAPAGCADLFERIVSGEPAESDAAEFVEGVNSLFDRMDSSFNFRPDEKEAEGKGTGPTFTDSGAAGDSAGESGAAEFLDLAGVACPMNFVRTKLRIEEMEIGAVLEVVLDDGEPIKNVPRSLDEWGQEILDIDKRDDGRFLLRVRKTRE